MAPAAEQRQRVAPEPSVTVLIVEDDVIIRLVIADYLRDCGYRVVEAFNADEAITILNKTDETVDVIFSDVQMPGSLDGFGLAQFVRQRYPHIKVVLTSGVAKATDAAESLCEDGPVIPKPYDAREVERRIRLFLSR